mgnify:CR=1 FL=1
MSISQIGNGDFPLNNCAILQKILKPEQLDFMQTFLRGDALINPIQEASAGVKNAIGNSISGIGSLPVAGIGDDGLPTDGLPKSFIEGLVGDGTSGNLGLIGNFQDNLLDFEQRTNRMSGVVTGFKEGEPDLGRILGIGSAYNSALATLATNPEETLKDNFSHGFNSLKKEFGIDAITQSEGVMNTVNNLLAEFGTGSTGNIPAADFMNQMNILMGDLSSVQQSIANIKISEDAFLSGALAFLDKYALANTALSGVLADPCMIGKVFSDLIASPDLESLLPSLQLPELPSIDEITAAIPNPEDIGNAIKDSVEGIVETLEETVEQLVDEAAKAGKELVAGIQKSAEDLIASGEALISLAEQAASDLAENVEEFGKDVDTFFANLDEESRGEGEEDDENSTSTTEVSSEEQETSLEESGFTPLEPQTQAEEVKYQSNMVLMLRRQEDSKFRTGGEYGYDGGEADWLALTFTLNQLKEAIEFAEYRPLPDTFNGSNVSAQLWISRIKKGIKVQEKSKEAEEIKERSRKIKLEEERQRQIEQERKKQEELEALNETRPIKQTYSGSDFNASQDIIFEGKIDLINRGKGIDGVFNLARGSLTGKVFRLGEPLIDPDTRENLGRNDSIFIGGVMISGEANGSGVAGAFDKVYRKLMAQLPSKIESLSPNI